MSRKSLFLVIPFLAMLIFVLPIAAQDIPREETVIFSMNSRVANPENFNPLLPTTATDRGLRNAVFEPLFILNYETGEVVGWQGESLVSNDALDVWTMKLRDGIMWSDGVPMTADDVVFTFELLRDNAAAFQYGGSVGQWVESIDKIDDLTVQFNLTGPNPRFAIDVIAVKVSGAPIVLPKHIWENQDPNTFTNYDPEQGWPVSTGAYGPSSVGETDLVYDRRDSWWGADSGFQPDMPAPRRLIWTYIESEEVWSNLAINNEIDRAPDSTAGTLEAILARNPNWASWYPDLPYAWPDPCPRALGINNTVAPWDDPEMRWALNYIIDRNELVVVAREGVTTASTTPFVSYASMAPFIQVVEDAGLSMSPTADVDKAREIIESKSYTLNSNGIYEKDGQELSLVLQGHENILEFRLIGEVMVEQLRRAGINASQQVVAGGTWSDNLALGNYEGIISWMPCGSINEPWATLDWATEKWVMPVGERSPANNNFVRWENQEYSDIVAQIGSLPLGDEQIPGLVVDAMQILHDEMPYIPLVQAAIMTTYNTTYWTNWPTSENNYVHPPEWWASWHIVLHELQPAGS
ncbi:MAG: ABC transporter substrate-binding protein [Anaerolineae bacterium]|nr:ABC transporter substrate-binding protein [Anaerolineae bacterium]